MTEGGPPVRQHNPVINSKDRIMILIDPHTRETWVENHTKFETLEMDGEVDAGLNDSGEWIVTIKARFTAR